MNFKKISDPNQGKKGKGNPTKSGTKVQVDLLLHVISNEGDNKDTIPIPCSEDQVCIYSAINESHTLQFAIFLLERGSGSGVSFISANNAYIFSAFILPQ